MERRLGARPQCGAGTTRGDGVADGPWEVRKLVRRNVKYGADLTKFCATGGVFSKGTKVGMTQYTLEEMQAIVDESHTHERRVAAHAHGTEGIKAAIRAGVNSVEHASFLDRETIRLAKKHGIDLALVAQACDSDIVHRKDVEAYLADRAARAPAETPAPVASADLQGKGRVFAFGAELASTIGAPAPQGAVLFARAGVLSAGDDLR